MTAEAKEKMIASIDANGPAETSEFRYESVPQRVATSAWKVW